MDGWMAGMAGGPFAGSLDVYLVACLEWGLEYKIYLRFQVNILRSVTPNRRIFSFQKFQKSLPRSACTSAVGRPSETFECERYSFVIQDEKHHRALKCSSCSILFLF